MLTGEEITRWSLNDIIGPFPNQVQLSAEVDCVAGTRFLQTEFGKHYCDAATQKYPKEIERECLPRLFEPSTGTPIKGAVLAFHGFTGCSDAYAPLAQQLAERGIVTYIPLLPGHGRKLGDGCDEATTFCFGNNPVDGLPEKAEEWVQFARDTVSMFNTDVTNRRHDFDSAKDPTFGVMGLSIGAGLTMQALDIDAKNGGVLNNALLLSPFFGVSPIQDTYDMLMCIKESAEVTPFRVRQMLECINVTVPSEAAGTPSLEYHISPPPVESSAFGIIASVATGVLRKTARTLSESTDANAIASGLNDVVRHLLTFVGGNPQLMDKIPSVKTFLDGNITWGEHCPLSQEQDPGRVGYCAFKARHIIAAHTFAQGTANLKSSNSRLNQRRLASIMAERDGSVTNGFTAGVLRSAREKGVETSACVFPIDTEETCGQDGADDIATNECGMPHSCLSRVENYNVPPLQPQGYWEENLFTQIGDFFINAEPVGTEAEAANREICRPANIVDSEYFATVNIEESSLGRFWN